MNISTKAIVSNSDMIKNYKNCRKIADEMGKIFIFKNNQPDAVLFSITEYERISVFIEHMECLSEKGRVELKDLLLSSGIKKAITQDLPIID
jgi:hypothetical protein